MTTSLNASSLFATSYYGLQNAYQYALQATSGNAKTGVSQNDLLTSTSSSLYGLQNSPFSSYMMTNFSQLDTNHDGKISGTEMTNVMNTFSKQGMTYNQLVALSGTSGVNSQDLNAILNNFRKIDRNGDGRVSQAEINYYNANKQITDKIDQLKKRQLNDISIMYPEDHDKDDDNNNSSSSSSSSVSSIL